MTVSPSSIDVADLALDLPDDARDVGLDFNHCLLLVHRATSAAYRRASGRVAAGDGRRHDHHRHRPRRGRPPAARRSPRWRAAFPGARVHRRRRRLDRRDRRRSPRDAGAEVVRSERVIGKGGAATLAARTRPEPRARARSAGLRALRRRPRRAAPRSCPRSPQAVRDGPLRPRRRGLRARASAAASASRSASRTSAIRNLTGLDLQAPISGQRALSGPAFATVVPFAPRFGMEIGMTVDAARAGFRHRGDPARPRPPRDRHDVARLRAPRPPARWTSSPSTLSRR